VTGSINATEDRALQPSHVCVPQARDSLPEAAVQSLSQPQPAVQTSWTTDKLISIRDVRELFGLGRTAAYELTHRPEFPVPVVISPRCYRWWASEVLAFAASIRSQGTKPRRPASCARRRREPDLSTSACRISGKVRTARTRRQAP
jgi:predicted DNA-binding transcriptional regulator AlpA